MWKPINKLIPDSFHKRILTMFILFAIVTGATTITIQYFYDKQTFRGYATETILNIHASIEDRIKDSILFDDIYTLFSVAENITSSVSLIRNIIILDANGDYITDALVSKKVPSLDIDNLEVYEIGLKNGKSLGKVAYLIDIDTINKTLLTHSLTSILFITPFIGLFIFLGATLIRYFTRPLKVISSRLKNADINELPITFKLPEYTSIELRKLAERFTVMSTELDNNIKTNIEHEKALAKEERLAAIGSMSAGLAHELRNPAMSLQMMIHSIKSSENKLEPEDMDVMSREVARIASTVSEFLKIAKPISIQPKQMDTESLKEILTDYTDRVMKGNIAISYSGDDFKFISDPLMLSNIFENLILNSYEAGATSCSLELGKTKDIVELTFIDNGAGINEEHTEKIFHPFYTTKSSGTGLGMSMCEKMITALGGSIRLDTGSSKGAKFLITIKDIK